MKIRFIKLHPQAVTPTRAHATDAGYDLTATSRTFDEHGAVVYGTGIAMEIPAGYVGLIFPRSSVSKLDFAMANAVGVIDSGYRGEITAKFKPMFRFSPSQSGEVGFSQATYLHQLYNPGERCAQLIIMPIPYIEFEEADALTDGERGANGYGSTGK